MSTATLSSLLDYLYGTLSPSNMRWLGEHLIERAEKSAKKTPSLRKYTMEEIDSMLDKAEHDFECGKFYTSEEVFRELDEDLVNDNLQLKQTR